MTPLNLKTKYYLPFSDLNEFKFYAILNILNLNEILIN